MMKLYLVCARDRTETPLFCTEKLKELSEYLDYSLEGIYSRLTRAKKTGNQCVCHGKTVCIVEVSDSDFKEVTNAKET